MDSHWAAENLQVIRTLMERSALYRRALGPILFYTGAIGIAAGALGQGLHIETAQLFAAYWLGVAALALAGSFVLARRQAMRDAEPFWSAPTRRVAQALAPPLAAGGFAGLLALANRFPAGTEWLPPIWLLFYGCALCSAGFSMQRGMRLLGWFFLIAGVALGALLALSAITLPSHWVMAATFGAAHLGAAVYLRFTGKDGE